MDKSNAAAIQREIYLAVTAIAAKHGLRAENLRSKFSAKGITFSGEMRTLSNEMPADFPRAAREIGVPEDCYGKTIIIDGVKMKIYDIKPRNDRFQVLAEGESGKLYKLSAFSVRRALQ